MYKQDLYPYNQSHQPSSASRPSHPHPHHQPQSPHLPNPNPQHPGGPLDVMKSYRSRKDSQRVSVLSKYTILGFISSGTYGRVYKAELKGTGSGSGLGLGSRMGSDSGDVVAERRRNRTDSSASTSTNATNSQIKQQPQQSNKTKPNSSSSTQVFAIKKFKPDGKDPPPQPLSIPIPPPILTSNSSSQQKQSNSAQQAQQQQPVSTTIYTGISQSAIREISLNRELSEGFGGDYDEYDGFEEEEGEYGNGWVEGEGGHETWSGCLTRPWGKGRAEVAINTRRSEILSEGLPSSSSASNNNSDDDDEDYPEYEYERIQQEAKRAFVRGETGTGTGTGRGSNGKDKGKRKERDHHFVRLMKVILEDKSIYMVFEYAEHDFLQIIHHHSQTLRLPIPPPTLKSLLHQLLLGVLHLHSHWILHRDLKPANILVTSSGVVKIGDLGLARLARDPLLPLWNGDKVVVTIWYRAPELLLGARHYTPAIDLWAVGCIYAELLALRPIFKGEEAKPEHNSSHHHNGSKAGGAGGGGGLQLQNLGAGVVGVGMKNLPFQSDQMGKIVEVLGNPDKERWPDIIHLPEWPTASRQERRPPNLAHWFQMRSRSTAGYDLLTKLFEYDPMRRVTAREALGHKFFSDEKDGGLPMRNAFAGADVSYPIRRLTHEDNGDHKMGSQPALASLQAMQGPMSGPHGTKRDHASSVGYRQVGTGSAGPSTARKRTRLGM